MTSKGPPPQAVGVGELSDDGQMFLLPLGHRLVSVIGLEDGHSVLDVAAGTGNAAMPPRPT